MYGYTCIEKLRQLVSFYGGGAKCWNITNIKSWVGWCMGQSVWKQIESKNDALHRRMQGTVYTGKCWYTTKWRVRILNLCKKKYMHALAMTIEAHADKEGA